MVKVAKSKLLCGFLFISTINAQKKIAIVHYRVGRTDGVSLEIDKRKQILTNLGYEVKLISGPLQHGTDYVIDELEFEQPEILAIKENSFAFFKRRNLSPQQLQEQIDTIAQTIQRKFLKYHAQEKFDLILIHNIFSLGLHLPAAAAFTKIAAQLNIPMIATHHDYYWERKEFRQPTSSIVEKFLREHVPPPNHNIVHICINSLAQTELKQRRNIMATIFPDVFEFEQPLWQKDAYNNDFLETIGLKQNDLFILQATRIVERKGIELAIHFVHELEKQKEALIDKTLYNGKKITKESKIILVLPGYTEQFAIPYLKRLKNEIKRTGIKALFIDQYVAAQRQNGTKKVYSLWDTYVYADLITFPSLYEGWGNQFIEAIFAKKPTVIFEYPVFEADIKREGYHVISLGNKLAGYNQNNAPYIAKENLQKAVKKTIDILCAKNTHQLLEQNFEIGAHYHGKNSLKQFLKKQLNHFFYKRVMKRLSINKNSVEL